MRKAIVILAALAVALCTAGTPGGMMDDSRAADLPLLMGLAGISVRVACQGSSRPEEYGFKFTERTLRSEIESMVRQRGLKVFSGEDVASVPGRPVLFIAVHTFVREESNVAAINVSFQLVEDAYLGRRPAQQLRAAVWTMSSLTFVELDKPQETGPMREDLVAMMDSFCREYFAANPRRQ